MVWGSILFLIASTVVSYLLAPKPPAPAPASLEDFTAPTAEQGKPIPVIFGDVLIKAPNVVWYGDLHTEKIYSKGGKK